MVSSSQSSIKNISTRRTQELAFCKEVAAKCILRRNTLRGSTNTTHLTPVFSTRTPNGTLRGSKASIKWTWRWGLRTLSMLNLLFWKTGLRWIPMCWKDTLAREFIWTITLRIKASHRSTLETNWTLRTQARSNSSKHPQLLDLMITKPNTVESSLETTMWVKSELDRTR